LSGGDRSSISHGTSLICRSNDVLDCDGNGKIPWSARLDCQPAKIDVTQFCAIARPFCNHESMPLPRSLSPLDLPTHGDR
jgi:hypothetical protein